jgi:hypothetical protein
MRNVSYDFGKVSPLFQTTVGSNPLIKPTTLLK